MKNETLLKTFVVYFFFIYTLIALIGGIHTIYGAPQVDEVFYKRVSDNFSIENVIKQQDTKPIFFLYLEYLLDADILKTRILNFILILLVTLLIYDITKNKLSFAFILIPIFLTSMWLTAEIIELFFLLLCFRYQDKSGLFLGIGAAFRPYSAFYAVFLNRKQIVQFLMVGIIAVSIMLYTGVFESYSAKLAMYGTVEETYDEIGWFEILNLILWLAAGLSTYKIMNNTPLWKWQLVSLLPLWVRLYGHYFLIPYTLLFMGFLFYDNGNRKL